jgi:hypothetical protein
MGRPLSLNVLPFGERLLAGLGKIILGTKQGTGWEHKTPKTGCNTVEQGIEESMRGKDGRLSFAAHKPKVGVLGHHSGAP